MSPDRDEEPLDRASPAEPSRDDDRLWLRVAMLGVVTILTVLEQPVEVLGAGAAFLAARYLVFR